jgi:hypothetical protein
MKKLFIAISIALAGCTPTGGIVTSPPLSATSIDEKALVLTLETFDTMLTAVDRLVDAKIITPGSPRAIQIANVIAKAKVALQAASAAQRAGNASSYLAAIGDAQAAIANINTLIKG